MTLAEYVAVTESACEQFDDITSKITTYLEKAETKAEPFDEKYYNTRSAVLSKLEASTKATIDKIADATNSFINKDSTKKVINKLDEFITTMPGIKTAEVSFYDVVNMTKTYDKFINIFDKKINMIRLDRDRSKSIEEITKDLKSSISVFKTTKKVKVSELTKLMTACTAVVTANTLDLSVYTIEKDFSKNQIESYISAVKARDILYIGKITLFKKLIVEMISTYKAVINGKSNEYVPSGDLIKEYAVDVEPINFEESSLDLDLYLNNVIESCKPVSKEDLIKLALESITNEIINESDLLALESEIRDDIEQNDVIEESAETETDENIVYEMMLDNIISELSE